MEKLPSGYKNVDVCYQVNSSRYIDTGIMPSSDIEIEIACVDAADISSTSTRCFVFGARDGTSNTSKGINLAKNYTNGYYFSYNTTNTLISSTKGNFSDTSNVAYPHGNLAIFKLEGKVASLTETLSYNALDESSVASFTCTHPMYLFALNNNGTALVPSTECGIAYCKIWEQGVLVRHYVACHEISTDKVGMYELLSGTFTNISNGSNMGYYSVDVEPTTNGNGVVRGSIGIMQVGELVAVPDTGYVFTRWEYNGQPLSAENPFVFSRDFFYKQGLHRGDTFSPEAIFVKATDKDDSLGFKMKVYSSIPTRYNISGGAVRFVYLSKGVYPIRSAKISKDGKQKTASTFVMEGEFNVVQGDYVYVYSPTGKNVFNGVVDTFDNNTITCGETRSVYSKETLFHSNSSFTVSYNTGNGLATITIPNSLLSFALAKKYLNLLRYVSDDTYTGTHIETPSERFTSVNNLLTPVSYCLFAPTYYGEPNKTNFPLITETSVKNLYEYLCDLFSEFGVLVESQTIPTKEMINGSMVDHLQIIMLSKSASADVLVIGDNMEQISNVKVVEESNTSTALYIFNSAGTQCRGAYVIDNTNTIVPETSQQISVYVPKVVLSDDNINTVVESNLSAGKYNHQITFDVSLDNKHNLTFDDFTLNKRVDFYNGNKLYRSVITAVSYSIEENANIVRSIKVTLGMARNNLTSKLNLRKVKK